MKLQKNTNVVGEQVEQINTPNVPVAHMNMNLTMASGLWVYMQIENAFEIVFVCDVSVHI